MATDTIRNKNYTIVFQNNSILIAMDRIGLRGKAKELVIIGSILTTLSLPISYQLLFQEIKYSMFFGGLLFSLTSFLILFVGLYLAFRAKSVNISNDFLYIKISIFNFNFVRKIHTKDISNISIIPFYIYRNNLIACIHITTKSSIIPILFGGNFSHQDKIRLKSEIEALI